MASLRAAGPHILVYTVNKPQRAAELLRWGVDSICTDAIDLIGPNFRGNCTCARRPRGRLALQHSTVGVWQRLLPVQVVILLYPQPVVIQLRLKASLARATGFEYPA